MLGGLGQGPYSVVAFSRRPIQTLGSANPVEIDPGGPRARLGQVAGGDTDVLLVLEPGTSLRGHVVDETGQVLRGARVFARLVSETAFGYSLQTSSALTDGSFQLDLPPGTYDLTARGKAGPGETRRVEVSQQVSGVMLVAPR